MKSAQMPSLYSFAMPEVSNLDTYVRGFLKAPCIVEGMLSLIDAYGHGLPGEDRASEEA